MKIKLEYSLVLFLFTMVMTLGCGPNPAEQRRLQQEAVGRGRALYLANGCAVCHGREGRGDGINAKRYYPVPTNFHDSQSYQQGISRGAIMRTIKNGVPREGSAMAAFGHLTDQELRDLAIFLESLQVAADKNINKEESQ